MTFQTFTGPQYLKIDIANNYGLDKLTWDERLAWFDNNEHQLDQLLKTAKEPALFYAGIKAWRDVQAGKPIGYMISLDATSSGLQLLAALTCDRKAASICNVIDSGERENAYMDIYNAMTAAIGETGKIDPDDVKQAVMTSLYGSKAVPKSVFGEGNLLNVFYDTMVSMAPAAWELNEAFLAIWNGNALSHDWVLPDNFHVHVKVMSQVRETVHFLNEPFDVFYNVNAPMPEGRSLGANCIHSIDGMIVREMSRRCDYNPKCIQTIRDQISAGAFDNHTLTDNDNMVVTLWQRYQDSGYLSARILDHINPDNLGHVDIAKLLELLDSLPERPFRVVSIHDCFRCLPHYANDLRKQYNLQLEMIARSNLLSNLVSQIIGKPIQIGKMDPSMIQQIRKTNYALS